MKESIKLILLQLVKIEFLLSFQMEFHLNMHLMCLSLQFNKMPFHSSETDESILKSNDAKCWQTNTEMGVLLLTIAWGCKLLEFLGGNSNN